MQQHKLELKNKNFFLRGYIVSENSGDAYDTRFAAINVNRAWKSDVQWFTDYASTYIPAYLGGIQQAGLTPEQASTQAHVAARQAADTGRLLPGTPAFESAFNKVINDGKCASVCFDLFRCLIWSARSKIGKIEDFALQNPEISIQLP